MMTHLWVKHPDRIRVTDLAVVTIVWVGLSKKVLLLLGATEVMTPSLVNLC